MLIVLSNQSTINMKKILLVLALISFIFSNAQNTLDFDGSNDYVDCGNDTSIQINGKSITLEAWIYATSWKTNAYDGNIIAKEYNTSNDGYMLRCGAGGKLNFALGNGSWNEITTANTVLSLNTWHHVAGTYDGSMMRLYLDGVAIDSLSFNGSIPKTPNNNLYIGAHLTYSRYYQGQIDEVKIWNICRTASQIANSRYDELCSKTNGLRAYYKFNHGKPNLNNPTVKKLTDLSGFGNHGTLNNFGLTGNSSNWIKGQVYKKSVTDVSDTVVVCDRYLSPSRKFLWTKSGIYYDTIPTYFYGCDSAITVHLTVKKTSSSSFSAHACDSFKSPSGFYVWKTSGTYIDKLKNSLGCDSNITIYLKIGGNRDTIYPVVCNNYTVPSGKRTINISGNYFDTLVDYRNCDSIIDIRLKVNNNKSSNIVMSGCYSVMSPSGKKTFTQSGFYSDTIKTISGCDSFIGVQVKLLNSSATVNASSCKSYTSPDGRNTWTQSGTYIDTLMNMAFCDSFITYNIKILNPSYGNLKINACRNYVTPGKKRRWTHSGMISDTLVNHLGCDSILSIDLFIPTTDVSVSQTTKHLTALSSTGTFQWLDCSNFSEISGATNKNFTATSIGNYAVEVTDSGCIDTSNCYNVSSVSIRGLTVNDELKISPNPSSGKFNLSIPSAIQNARIVVHDMTGRVIHEGFYENFKEEELELSTSAGTYILEIFAEAYHAIGFLNIK